MGPGSGAAVAPFASRRHVERENAEPALRVEPGVTRLEAGATNQVAELVAVVVVAVLLVGSSGCGRRKTPGRPCAASRWRELASPMQRILVSSR